MVRTARKCRPDMYVSMCRTVDLSPYARVFKNMSICLDRQIDRSTDRQIDRSTEHIRARRADPPSPNTRVGQLRAVRPRAGQRSPHSNVKMNRSGFDAASFFEKDADYV